MPAFDRTPPPHSEDGAPGVGEKDFRNCVNDECPLTSASKLVGVTTQSMLRMKDFMLLATYLEGSEL